MERKNVLFYLNFILFIISSVAVVWYIGGSVGIAFDDFSILLHDFSRYFEYYSLNHLIPCLISLLFASFFGFNILKFIRDSENLRKKKFKIWLPITGIIISILGALLLIIYGFIISQINPTNNEVWIGVALSLMLIIPLGGLILTVFLGIIGFLIDKAIYNNNFSPILRFLKILMILFGIIIIISLIIIGINFLIIGCSSSDNQCILEKAKSENDPNICKNNQWCYMKFYETQDSSVCPSMPDKVDTYGGGVIFYNYKEKCYAYFAYKEKNIALCDFIREEDRDNCRRDNQE